MKPLLSQPLSHRFPSRLIKSIALGAAAIIAVASFAVAADSKSDKPSKSSKKAKTAEAARVEPAKAEGADAAEPAENPEAQPAGEGAATPPDAATAAPATAAAPVRPINFKNGPKSTNAVALTFDDGPHMKLTPVLLETLKNAGVQATFFMLGVQVDLYPDIAKAVSEAGFEIGNHTYSHKDMTKQPSDKIREEIRRTQDSIEKATGKRPKLFRPPYGSVNERVMKIINEEGLEVVTWSVDPRDWDRKATTEKTTSFILKHSEGGSIVCIHDIHAKTVNAIPAILAGLKEKGLQLSTAGEMIEKEKEDRLTRKTQGPAMAGENAPPQTTTVRLGKTGFRKAVDAKP